MTSRSNDKPWPAPANGSTAVLVVEDEPAVLAAVTKIVQQLSPSPLVLQATDQEAAKRLFHEHCDSIGLIITDLKLDTRPPGDFAGDELIAWLATQHSRCPIIILTGHGTMEHHGEKQPNPRIRAYIQKNIAAGELIRVLKREVGLALTSVYDLEIEGHGDWKQYSTDGKTLPRLDHPQDGWFEDYTWQAIPRADGPADLAGTFVFEPPDIYYCVLDTLDGTYLALDGDELRPLSAPGTPNLPFSVKRIALPQPMTDLTVELVQPDWQPFESDEDWDAVLPVPDHRLEGQGPSYTLTKAYWQSVRQVFIDRRTTDLDGVPCVTVKVCPFRYLPRSHRLEVLRSTRVRITGRPVAGSAKAPTRRRSGSPFASDVLGWPGTDGDDGPSGSRPPTDGHPKGGSRPSQPTYLAVGTAENLRAIKPLLDAHEQRFHIEKYEIVCTPAPASCESIRDAIRTRWQASDGPFYVLLSGRDTIPFFRYDDYLTLQHYQGPFPEIDDVPLLSDLYYGLFDREAPATGPRLFLGRLPFDEPEQLHAYAMRAAAGGHGPDWRHWLFLCTKGGSWDYNANVQQSLRGRVAGCSLLVSAHRGPAVDAAEPVTPARVNELLGKRPTLASFRGHGRRNGWLLCHEKDIYWPEAPGKTQSFTGLHGVFSIACCTAAPDHPHPGCGLCAEKSPGCRDSDSLGSSALNQERLSWFLGSSRISFSSANDVLYRSLTRRVCDRRRHLTIGELHWQSVTDLLSGVPGPDDNDQPLAPEDAAVIIDSAAMSILLGDPAAPVCSWPVADASGAQPDQTPTEA